MCNEKCYGGPYISVRNFFGKVMRVCLVGHTKFQGIYRCFTCSKIVPCPQHRVINSQDNISIPDVFSCLL